MDDTDESECDESARKPAAVWPVVRAKDELGTVAEQECEQEIELELSKREVEERSTCVERSFQGCSRITAGRDPEEGPVHHNNAKERNATKSVGKDLASLNSHAASLVKN